MKRRARRGKGGWSRPLSQRLPNKPEDLCRLERLFQDRERPGGLGAGRVRRARPTRNNDDRHLVAALPQLVEKIEAAHSREVGIENEAIRGSGFPAAAKSLGGWKAAGFEPRAFQQ